MDNNNSMLIIGPPKSGKTTFQAQLYARILANKGCIERTRTPKNILGLKNAYERLSDGLETETTPADENVETIIPVKWKEIEFDLVCKDYGGEQVRNITQLMEYDQNWLERAKSNDRWILFIRPGEIYHNYDLSKSGFAEVNEHKGKKKTKTELSDQYHFIELMQALLHARGIGTKTKIFTPTLLVALTCWDELKTDSFPSEVLKTKMPLFHHFLDSIWERGQYKIIGLSAQEFPLDNVEAQEKYRDELPESFGYLILENKTKERDLTKLIEISLSI